MKMKVTDYRAIKRAINRIPIGDRLAHLTHLSTLPRIKDLATRYRWDCFYYALEYLPAGFHKRLYEYLDDDHVDTALKSIIKDVNIKGVK